MPSVAALADLVDEADLARTLVDRGDIVLHGGAGAAHMDAQIAIGPGAVALKGQGLGAAVVDDALLEVAQGNGVADDVVSRRIIWMLSLKPLPSLCKGEKFLRLYLLPKHRPPQW